MKVIILCAGMGTRLGNMTETKPKCLISFKDKTLLEHSMNTLIKNGFDDIIVVGGYKHNMLKPYCNNIVINEDYNVTQPPYSVQIGLNSIESDDSVLIVDGDLIFNDDVIKEIKKNLDVSKLVTYIAKSPIEAGSRVELKNNRVIKIGRYISPQFPFQIHAGITYITKNDFATYKEFINKNQYKRTEMHVLLNDFCKEVNLESINIDKESIGLQPKSIALDGGSFSSVTVTKDANIIQKQCTKDTKRIINEIQFLQNLPEHAKPYFTEILECEILPDFVSYKMPLYNYSSLKKLILSNTIKTETAIGFIKHLCVFLRDNIYNTQKIEASNAYTESVHYHRVLARKDITIQKSPIFKSIFDADRIYINGVEHQNAIAIVNQMIKCDSFNECIKPKHLSLIHGDLHFDNILLDLENSGSDYVFKLVDPKGFKSGDYAYDMSKIIHNINGLYDLIYEYMFDLDYKIENNVLNANLNIFDCEAKSKMETLNKYLIPELNSVFSETDSMWYKRAKFIEAINFCCLQPFHLVGDNVEKKAIAMYLVGVQLINQFWSTIPNKLKITNNKCKIVNINTIEDYTYAQNLFTDLDKEQFPGV